jgi:RNA polymerase sigma factor (sigma-70 family)
MEHASMSEPTFDWREQLAGSDDGAWADGMESLADEELLRRYRDTREADAFNAMVHRHHPMVLRTCQRLAGNLHDAEDAAQTVFLVLTERPEVVRRSLVGCLHGLARAAVSELRRTRRRRTEREAVSARMRSLFTRLHRGSQPMEQQELLEELDAALAQLPDPLQQAVILRYLQGLSQQEAAKRAGCTTTTMGWRSMKGLQQLRGALSRRGVVVSSAALLTVLGAEAGSAAAQGFAAAATGPASAAAVRVAAALVKQSLPSYTLRRVAVVLLLTVGVAVGAGVAFKSPSTPPAPAETIRTAPSRQVARERPTALGLFDHSLDIGGPARAGSAQLDGDAFTIRGGGAHIYGEADQFRFVCRTWTGDGEIIARIHSELEQQARQVCAGVMFREKLTADSHHTAILLDAIGKCHLKYRDAGHPASACEISGSERHGKHWVRLVRRGNTFTAYTRPDGVQMWRVVKDLELPMRSSLYVGLAVTAHDNAQLATTMIDRVSLHGRSKP